MKRTREEKENRDLEELFDRYRQTPEGFVFVPLADACRKMGRIDEALEICEHGVRRHPAYPSGHVVKGKCLFDKGDREGSRDAFERVLLLDENNLVALKYLGMIEADAGNLVAAQRHFRHILSLDPENKEIKTILRIVDEQEEPVATMEPPSADVMEGVDEILRGSSEGPGADTVEEAAPDVDAEAGPTSEADPGAATAGGMVESAHRGDELETSDELASVTLAEIFASQGYKSKAEKIYREVLRRQPGSEDARKRLGELTSEGSEAGPQEENGFVETRATAREVRPEAVDFPSGGEGTSGGSARDEDNAPGPRSAADPQPAARMEPRAAAETDSAEARVEISEKDSLSHFRRWLTRMQK